MIRPLIISEEESKRILNLHRKTEKTVISEQRRYYRGADLKLGYVDGPVRLPDGATAISKEEYDKAISGSLIPSIVGSDKILPNTQTKDPKYNYIKFANFGEIPVLKNTKLYYSNGLTIDRTKNILGLEKSDKYGAYDEVYIEGWDTKVKRYYPTDGWEDWDFIYNNNIPYAFQNDNGLFSLVLILVDPIKSVVDINQENNKSRGWVLSGLGYKSNKEGDSATGYFKVENGNYIPYNITAPIIRGDQSTFHLDTRSDFDRFMDSNWGILAQIAVAVAVTLLFRNAIAMRLPAFMFASEAVTSEVILVNQMRARLMVASIITEAAVNVPMAYYYKQRGPEYENMMWISLLFCAVPLVQAKFFPNLISDFSKKTCVELAEKMMKRSISNAGGIAELRAFEQTLTMTERSVFYNVITSAKNLQKMGFKEELAKELEIIFKKSEHELLNESTDFWFAREGLILAQKNSPSFIKGLVVDLGSTLLYAKTVAKILETFSNAKAQKGVLVDNFSEEEKKKIEVNSIKLDKDLEKLPSFLKQQIKTNEFIAYQWSVTEQDFIWMVDNGILSDKFKQQIYMFPVRNFVDCKDLDQLNEKDIENLTDQLMSVKEVTESPDFKKVLTNEQQKIWKLFYKCIYKKTEDKNKKNQPSPVPTPTPSPTPITIDTQYDWTETDEVTVLKYGRDPRYETKEEPFMIGNVKKYKYFYRPKFIGSKKWGAETVQGDKSTEVKNLPPSNLEKLNP